MEEISVWIKRSIAVPPPQSSSRSRSSDRNGRGLRSKSVGRSRASNDGPPTRIIVSKSLDEEQKSVSSAVPLANPVHTSHNRHDLAVHDHSGHLGKSPHIKRVVRRIKKSDVDKLPANVKLRKPSTPVADNAPPFSSIAISANEGTSGTQAVDDSDDLSVDSALEQQTSLRKPVASGSSQRFGNGLKRVIRSKSMDDDDDNDDHKVGGTDHDDDDNKSVRSTHSAFPSMMSSSSPKQQNSYEWAKGWMTKTEEKVMVRLDPSEVQPGKVAPTVTLSIDAIDKDILIANTEIKESVPPHDLVTLDHFHEPTVVECLQLRFLEGYIYTSTGPVLIALNPFKPLTDLYSDEMMERFWDRAESASNEELPPHVYAIADNSFRNMMRGIEMSGSGLARKLDQSILVSGESGAGKTVTTKYIMKYLAALSQRANQAGTKAIRAYEKLKPKEDSKPPPPRSSQRRVNANAASLSGSSSSSIEAQVLQSNPILESFGNARTVRNDNSSRFGKFIRMQFTSTGRLVGTRIDTYLLENVRVVHQNYGERNYHVFYELLAAAGRDKELAALLQLDAAVSRPHDFKILCGSGTYDRRDGVADTDTYQDLVKAMRMIGFTDEEKKNVFCVAASVMHASNLKFKASLGGEGSELADGKHNEEHLANVCNLLGVTKDALNEALCFSTITARGSEIKSPRNVAKAEKGLDAFLKATYHALFTFLVQRVNESISIKEDPKDEKPEKSKPCAVIGVLDIFGFESFTVNSFEQLCINYCNEVLQQQFNTFMLKNEQEEYASEGIDWDFVQFPENQDVLDLIGDKSNGIMSILDDMCRTPRATDQTFAAEMAKRCETNKCFKTDNKLSAEVFSVKHYAGAVEYTTDDFVEKNRNDLPKETSVLLLGSDKSFVHRLANIISGSGDKVPVSDSAEGKGRAKAARHTVGGQFRQQVKDLRQNIDSTCPHYVRCIKPNSVLLPEEYDAAMVANQLKCGGIMQAVSVTRDGFTLHYTHAEFIKRYKNIFPMKRERSDGDGKKSKKQIESECKELVNALLVEIEKEEHSSDDVNGTTEQASSPKTKSNDSDDGEDLVQFGKTKVLLKHHAFESLERLLGAVQNKTATQLNAIFRRYLCRIAFNSVRDTFHAELQSRGETFDEWFKENRELYYRPRDKGTLKIPNLVRHRMEMFQKAAAGGSRSKKKSVVPSKKEINLENPAWLVNDGLWQRNSDYVEE